MLKLSCPSCGAEVTFQSKSSIFAVCSYCKSSLVRQDMNLEALGKVADLQDDLTPIQIGTSGELNRRRFEVIGRIKVGYDQGFWNEWHIILPNYETGWLAEAQGFYAVCFPYALDKDLLKRIPPANELQAGGKLNFPMDTFVVNDIKATKYLTSEGELPFTAMQDKKSVSVDLSKDNKMATLEYGDEIRLFFGQYIDFDDLNFSNLRRIDGWELPRITKRK